VPKVSAVLKEMVSGFNDLDRADSGVSRHTYNDAVILDSNGEQQG
jgi:hypothetical protein